MSAIPIKVVEDDGGGGGMPSAANSEQAQDANKQGQGGHNYTNSLQRVKVYRLNDHGHWDDKGTGHVSCEYMEVRQTTTKR